MQNEIKNVYSGYPPSSVVSQSAPNDDGLLTPMSILSSSPTTSKKNISSSSPSSITSTTSSSSIQSPINDITNINFNSNYYHSHRRHNSNGNSIQHKNINGLHKSKSITELPQQQQTSSPSQPQRLPYRPQHPTQELRKSFSSLQEFLNYTEKISGANIQQISSITGTKNNNSNSNNFIIVNSVDKSNSVKYISQPPMSIKTVNPHYYVQPDNRFKRDEPISRHSPKSLTERKGCNLSVAITSQSSSPPSPSFFPRYAGAAFNNSPPPDSLPLPNFSMTPKTPNGSPTQEPMKNIQRPLDLSEMNLDSTSHNRNSATNSPKSSIEGIPMNTGNQYNIVGTILIGTASQQQTHANGYMNSLLSSPKSTTGNVDAVYLDHLSTSLKKMLNIQSVNA